MLLYPVFFIILHIHGPQDIQLAWKGSGSWLESCCSEVWNSEGSIKQDTLSALHVTNSVLRKRQQPFIHSRPSHSRMWFINSSQQSNIYDICPIARMLPDLILYWIFNSAVLPPLTTNLFIFSATVLFFQLQKMANKTLCQHLRKCCLISKILFVHIPSTSDRYYTSPDLLQSKVTILV